METVCPTRLLTALLIALPGALAVTGFAGYCLARVFNGTLTRLEQAFEQMRRFTADASHELRTPLTAIRSVGEVGLQRAKSPEQYQEVIGGMLEEANRLARLVDNLLIISRADAGQVSLQMGLVWIMDVVQEAVVNVLHNAIRFSPVRSSIGIRVWKQFAQVLISITDSGSGIAEEHRETVFHRFYRATGRWCFGSN